VRPPRTFSRLMAKAAHAAMARVMAPAAQAIHSEFQICTQKLCR
jgi:hypothetical protein